MFLKSVVIRAIALLFFAPVCLALIWLALPHLIGGSDVLVALVTGVAVLIGSVVVYCVNKICVRIDDCLGDESDDASV